MDKIKNYAIAILSIALCITLFILYCQTPKVVKSETYITRTTNGTTMLTIHDQVAITGATNVTHNADGTTTASGTNLSIGSQTQTMSTVVTHTEYKEKEITKYATSDWAVSISGSVPLTFPLTPQFNNAIIYRRILFTGYLGVGYSANNSAIVSVMITF